MKGLVSVGVVGFMKTLALNPWNWWNWRNTGLIGGRRRTSNAGRDNAVNISWAAVVIGVASAIYLFYQWMQSLVAYALLRVGERVVDTHLPGDDDDIKPPPGWKSPSPTQETSQTDETSSRPQQSSSSDKTNEKMPEADVQSLPAEMDSRKEHIEAQFQASAQTMQDASGTGLQHNPDLTALHRQGWSFGSI